MKSASRLVLTWQETSYVARGKGYWNIKVDIEGVNQTIKNLNIISTAVARPAVKAGMRAYIQVLKKAIRNNIRTGVTKPGNNLTSVRATTGAAFKRSSDPDVVWAKVGGKAGKPQDKQVRGGGQTSGKGISTRNAHWWFIGTGQRYTKTGASRGKMWGRNTKPRPVQKAYMKSRGTAAKVAKRVMKKKFFKLMKKRIVRKIVTGRVGRV